MRLLFVDGIAATVPPLHGEANDGVVLLAEVLAEGDDRPEQVATAHTWLPANGEVASLILERLASSQASSELASRRSRRS